MLATGNAFTQRETIRYGSIRRAVGAILLTAIALGSWHNATAGEESRDVRVTGGVRSGDEQTTSRQQAITHPRQILLDVRVATMRPRHRSKLGTWQKVILQNDESAVSPEARTRRTKSSRPIKAQLLCASDSVSSEVLLAEVKELEGKGRLRAPADFKIGVQGGMETLLRTHWREWFVTCIRQTTNVYALDGMEFWIGPAMLMTADVDDGRNITIATAFEVSNRDEVRHFNHPDSEVVTQRTKPRMVTLESGGTVVWAGLVQFDPEDEHPSGLGRLPLISGLFRNHQAAKRTRETVIFVTAYLIAEHS